MTPFDATGPAMPLGASAPALGLPDVDVSTTFGRRPALRALRDLTPPITALGDAVGISRGGIRAMAVSGSRVIVATGPMGCLRVTDLADPDGAQRVLGTHGAYVQALLVRGDSLFSAGSDGRVLAWRLGGENLSMVVGCHGAGVTTMLLTVDRHVLTGGHDGHLVSWSGGDGRIVATHPGGVEAASGLASGTVVTAGRDGRLVCWRPGARETPVELPRRRREMTLAMTTIGSEELVTATGQLGVVHVWRDLEDGAWPEEVGVHGGWVLAVVALDDDHVAAVGGDHVTVWDLASGSYRRIPLDGGLHATRASAMATGDLVVAGSNGSLHVVEAARLAA